MNLCRVCRVRLGQRSMKLILRNRGIARLGLLFLKLIICLVELMFPETIGASRKTTIGLLYQSQSSGFISGTVPSLESMWLDHT
ncbi:hypothetical protein PUN28_014956 [Cardiocondyla obscurior]|uniref:Uncharacterized protein n=1 Tax=Cardiocondyla obscurior TaxID=286306 RepID=A0AAW2EY22_9HYME